MRVLIAGCGYVGGELGRRLAEAGHRVWGLRRSSSPLPPGVERVAADVTEPESLRDLPAGLDAVVYAVSADGFEETAYRRAYVEGPANLRRALGSTTGSDPRFVFVSSTGVYGQRDGSWVDEHSPTEPGGFSGRLVLEGEQRTIAAGPHGHVVRLAGLYGPARVLLVDRLRAGEASCTEDPPRYLNLVHRDDAAGILTHVVALANPPRVLLGVDDEPVDRCVILRWLADRLGVAPPRVEGGDESGRRGGRSNKRCSNRLLHGTGYRLRVPTFRDGFSALVPPPDGGASRF